MTAGLIGSAAPLAEAFDLALVDLDGVAYRGPLPIDHAAPSLTGARDALFVTKTRRIPRSRAPVRLGAAWSIGSGPR